jgi:hypothetical protein
MTEHIPSIVMALADKVGKTALSWFVASDHVEIVFTTGEKLRFEKEQMAGAMVGAIQELPHKPPKEEFTPVIHNPKPAPVKRHDLPSKSKKK